MDDTILKKCEFYYSHLKSQKINNIPEENVLYVLDVYKKLNKLKGNYLNHGDIQASNIISNHQNHYLIDFDEALVGPYLYDYAVIVIKMFTKRKVNNRKIKNLQKKIIDNNKNVTIEDFSNIIKLYLCKILLEKYYLHSICKIDLFSKNQKKDNYLRYLNILKRM